MRTAKTKNPAPVGAGFLILRSALMTLDRSAPYGDGANNDDDNKYERVHDRSRHGRKGAAGNAQVGQGEALGHVCSKRKFEEAGKEQTSLHS